MSLIRNSKSAHTEKIAEKLRSLSSKHWWSVLKSFISPASKSSLPPIEQNGTIYTDDQDKAHLLNNFFCDQTVLNDQNAVLPNITPFNVTSSLETVTLTSLDVESVLKTLVLGKASGPNGLNNRILKELAHEISAPPPPLYALLPPPPPHPHFMLYSTTLYQLVIFQRRRKMLISLLFLRKAISLSSHQLQTYFSLEL